MKLTLKRLKPRNPVAVAATRRAAGTHRPANGACRQIERRAVRNTLRSEWDAWRKTT